MKRCLFIALLLLDFLPVAGEGSKAITDVVVFNNTNGLPQNVITCIEQDKYGYTWFGTRSGVCRFDGNEFMVYDQMKGYTINHLFNDSENNLWMATDQGFFLLNRVTDSFNLVSEGFIRDICGNKGKVYFLLTDRIMEVEGNSVKQLVRAPGLREFLIHDTGMMYCQLSDGIQVIDQGGITSTILNGHAVSLLAGIGNDILAGCRTGELFVIDRKGNHRKIGLDNHNEFREIAKIGDEIWLATDGNGIIILDSDYKYLKSYRKNYPSDRFIPSNSIYDIFRGNDQEIWIATYGMGVVCLLNSNSPFTHFSPEPGNINSLVDNEGVSTFCDHQKIYMGTNYGLSVYDSRTGNFKNLSSVRMINDLNGSKVQAINKDSGRNIWIGTYDGLLGKYTDDLKLVETCHPFSNDPGMMQQIIFIHRDGDNLLIGSHFPNRNLIRFNPSDMTYTPFTLDYNNNSGTNLQINGIRKNQDGKLIAVIRNLGLFTVNSKFTRLENDLDEINRRMTFRINDFYHDRKGRYWLATQKDGLVMMSADGMVFEKWTIREGLPTNTLMRMESVDDRYLWISTISGICRFDTQTFQTMVFTNRHGLPASEFNPRTSDVTENGHIIFGSTAGFTMVNPESVEPDISQTEVVISDISFHNQSIRKLAGKPILTKALEETERIVLPFRKNSFTIRFFTRDKHLPKFNNFAYRLTGFENEWIYPGETSHCTYTNLSPGKYIFEVKATNKSNIWMEKPTTLKITIKSPYYLSWYAYLFYFLLVGSVILISLQIYRNRLNLKKELEISAYKVQKEKELTEKKLSFFTNISHDLKTPLTLIDAPLNDLLQSGNLSGEQIRKLNIIRRNSKRLFNLISDLVDFRKLTQEKIPLNIRKVNIKELFDQIEEAFRVECKMKSIDLMIHITCDEWVYVDQNKLEKIVWNLMSNAVKFTPEGGEIYLGVECLQDTGSIKMTVKDTGIGIGESELKKIFDRFYQVKEKNIRYEGTGIGLSIVKELVELHKGTIHVASTPGSGTVFTVILPLGKEISSGEDEETGTENKDLIPPSEGLREVIPPGTETVSTQYNLSKLLIVEDNTELREYLASHFCRNYKVVQASDGYEGFRNAMEKNPDIILADVLMPNLDGFEFCRMIRANFDTSHIPVVMLTSNSSDESRIEGISTGADAYVTKPFDISFLDALLRTLLENRRKLRDKLVDSVMPVGDKDGIHTRDAEFMGKVRAYIEKNIGDTDLTIDHLSSELGISRTQLNRKIKSLSGHTPNNLIKIIRLKKAYKLIRNQGVRVSEAAYMTGFSDPNYFTVCFRKEFGENPSQVN